MPNDTTLQRLARCALLHHWDGWSWHQFPAWAHFLTNLGWDLHTTLFDRERAVVALCVPHRGFAACLAALGALLAEPLPQPTAEDGKRHFLKLVELPDPAAMGTALTYLRNGRKMRGVFAGTCGNSHEPYVKICVQSRSRYSSGGLTYYVGEADAMDVQIEPDAQPILGHHSAGTALVSHPAFVNQFYTRDELHLLHVAPRCQVVIIGRINAMREEAIDTVCGLPGTQKKMSEGVLNDILRIRRFISGTGLARVAAYPTHGDADISSEHMANARLVIFDGTDAFTKWGSSFPEANLLVILDRTETLFNEGLSQVNARYYLRSGEYQLQSCSSMPHGIDGTGFLEVRR